MDKKYQHLFLATTDTVVGIGAPIADDNKTALYYLKKRPHDKGLIIMVGNYEQARTLADWSDSAATLAQKYWPGATTLVLSKNQAVRMPDNKKLCALINRLGPIYMTSANVTGQDPLSLAAAKKAFPQIKKYYDFGIGSGRPSQIIDVQSGKIIRK